MIRMILTHQELMDTVSTEEYAALHGVCFQRVWQLCDNKGEPPRILGARKEGRNWRIPRKAPYPEDTRRTRHQKAREDTE